MEFEQAKNEFINAWGGLGSAWGVNKTMAQIFALLFISPEPLSVEQIMEELGISRGNCSMNLRSLMDWDLIYKTIKKGDRREYFYTDDDFWLLSRKVTAERAKRELDPLIRVLQKVDSVPDSEDAAVTKFRNAIANISEVVISIDSMLKMYLASNSQNLSSSADPKD